MFARISQAVYAPPDSNLDYFASIGMAWDYLENDTNELYVLYNEHDLVIAFRGTEARRFTNIAEDLEANLVQSTTRTGKVHHGFQHALENLWPGLLALLKQRLKQQTVWLTGHSLGAAMAVLAANRLHDEPELGVRPKAVFTFGCPRNGDRHFSRSLKVPHYRWVNNADIVTKVPFFPYFHSGDMFYINRLGKVKRLSASGRLLDQLAAILRGLFHGKAIALNDHSIRLYSASLEQYQRENR